ncbi:hypothetical protein Ciccas_013646, partial [Cichlidogyrus casuarinus]
AAIISPALRAIGNLVIGTDKQTQAVLDCGLLKHVPTLLNNQKSTILKEACWMLSNITAGTQSQISAVIHFNIIPSVLKLLETAEFKVQKEACWAVCNVISGGTGEQYDYLFSQGVLGALTSMLSVNDSKIIGMVMEALEKLFENAKEHDNLETYCLELENCRGLDLVEKLQDHENAEMYSYAYKFIEKYFNDAEEEETDPQESTGSVANNFSQDEEFTFKNTQASNFDF